MFLKYILPKLEIASSRYWFKIFIHNHIICLFYSLNDIIRLFIKRKKCKPTFLIMFLNRKHNVNILFENDF